MMLMYVVFLGISLSSVDKEFADEIHPDWKLYEEKKIKRNNIETDVVDDVS